MNDRDYKVYSAGYTAYLKHRYKTNSIFCPYSGISYRYLWIEGYKEAMRKDFDL